MKVCPPLLALALLLATAPAQRVWIVNKAGGVGVDFTDLAPAIAAAAPGDTISITGGMGYTWSTLTKALTIEAPTGTTLGLFPPGFDVSGIPAGATVRLAGFAGAADRKLEVKQCQGTVIVQRFGSIGVSATNVANLMVSDSNLTGYYIPFNLQHGGAVNLSQSQAIVQRCTLDGRVGSPYYARTDGGSALAAYSGSTAVCADCKLTGGAGVNGDYVTTQPCATSGGTAILCDATSSVVVLGNSKLTGGPPGTSLQTTCAPTVQGPAASGNVLLASEVTMSGVLTGGARATRSLAWFDSPGQGSLGGITTITVRGAPLTTLQVFLDTGFGVLPVPGWPVPYQGTAAPVYLGTFVLGASGALPLPIPIPYYPPWSGWTFYFHALAFEAGTGALSCTNPADLLLK